MVHFSKFQQLFVKYLNKSFFYCIVISLLFDSSDTNLYFSHSSIDLRKYKTDLQWIHVLSHKFRPIKYLKNLRVSYCSNEVTN